jgi:two-component system OmpR family sensor kinase
VPEPVLQRLTERFVRAASQRFRVGVDCQTIVEGVNARMVLVSPATGRSDGFEVCVWLPVVAPLEG